MYEYKHLLELTPHSFNYCRICFRPFVCGL